MLYIVLFIYKIKCPAFLHNTQALLAVDNTYLTPYFLRPLELGAHISMYSLSKYMNGHGDVIMGAVVVNDDKLEARLRHMQESTTVCRNAFSFDSQLIHIYSTPSFRHHSVPLRLLPGHPQP